jgi:flagellin-like protein
MVLNSKKRGISPIVASVLLIMLVLILAGIVFTWARGFIGEQIEKKDQPISKLCDEIDFSIDLILKNADTGTYDLEIVNRGNHPIFNFLIEKHMNGDSTVEEYKFSVGPGENLRREINLFMNGELSEKVIIYPSLLGKVVGEDSNRPYACMKNGKEKTL